MHLDSKAEWAMVDDSIHCLADQGTDEFWEKLMKQKLGGEPTNDE